MKRFVFAIVALLSVPAFAEIAPDWYLAELAAADESVVSETVADEPNAELNTPIIQPAPTTRATNRATATSSRVAPATATTSARAAPSRVVASRNAVIAAPARATAQRVAPSRSATPITTRARAGGAPNVARAATSEITQTDTVNTPLYTSRGVVERVATERPTTAATRTSATVRAATGFETTTTETTQLDADAMAEISELTDFCKTQYASCMDQFCNVLDDNQGRCSCSANLTSYSGMENRLAQATADLQQVARDIQYIGLTADDVRTLYTQTEAEATMGTVVDSTKMMNDMNNILSLVSQNNSVQNTASTSSSTLGGITLDMDNLLDFSFSSTSFDLGSLLGNSTNTASISNQRGEDLFKTATARCKASVLTSCAAQGIDASIITNSYDLEIDKQCIVYERGLTDATTEMTQTVSNAKTVLQRARLMVAQKKNEYDMRTCVNELDKCMTDEFVCGSDYDNCLDPTGKFIANGNVVVGSHPGKPGDTSGGLYGAWGTAFTTGSLSSLIDDASYTGSDVASFLKQKIGHLDSDKKSTGMCMGVLNKCQNYTYDKNGAFREKNDVVSSYLLRTLTLIKAQQDEVLADYAQNCQNDLMSCLTTNNASYSYNYNSNDLSPTSVSACRTMANTCASVNGTDNTSDAFAYSVWNGRNNGSCPSNAYTDTSCTAATTGVGECVRTNCRCQNGYQPSGTSCILVP